MNASVNVRFCGEIDDVVRRMFFKYGGDGFLVGDIALHERIPCIFFNVFEIVQVARIGQLVEVDDCNGRIFSQNGADEIGADKARSATDLYCFAVECYHVAWFF